MRTEIEIATEIKSKKLKIKDMPAYISAIISEELEDYGYSQFIVGKEEGKAEAYSEIEDTVDDEIYNNGYSKDQLDYAIVVLKDIEQTGQSVSDRIREMQIEACRFM